MFLLINVMWKKRKKIENERARGYKLLDLYSMIMQYAFTDTLMNRLVYSS